MEWLLISVLNSSTLLFISTHPGNPMSRRFVKNMLLVIQAMLAAYGTFLALGMPRPYSSILTNVGLLLLAGIIAGIYQTSWVPKRALSVNMLHVLNITIGSVLAFGTWYFVYLFYLYSEDGNGDLWKLFIPIVVYGIAYAVQMKVIKLHQKRIAYSVAVMQLVVPIVLLQIWRALAAGEGML